MKPLAVLALVMMPQLAVAFEPALPAGARQLADQVHVGRYYDLPIGVTRNGDTPTERVRGSVRLQSWKIEGRQIGLGELEQLLGTQLTAQGYELMFRCQTEDCGGFDFRFDTLVLPPPEMFVDLSNFRFLAAARDTAEGREAVGLMLSHTSSAATIQTVSVSPKPAATPATTGASPQPPAAAIASGQDRLDQDRPGQDLDALTRGLTDFGHVVLGDLTFETGSSTLAGQDYASLQSLARWLGAQEHRRIALVGHTDSEGALEPNVQLSRARAAAVEHYLTETLGVAPGQIEAHGLGYLAPIASNATHAGRDKNRRVEAVLISAP